MNFHTSIDGPDFSRFDAGFRGSRVEVFPILSRSNNIGDHGGFHEFTGISNFLHKDASKLSIGDNDNFVEIEDRGGLIELCSRVPFGPDTRRQMCSDL